MGLSEPYSEHNMPKYQFTEEPIHLDPEEPGSWRLPDRRIVADYKNREQGAYGTFSTAELYVGGVPVMQVGNCEGSLMVIDRRWSGVGNKLHIGELLMSHPHIESHESHGKEGPRADLHDFDLDLATRYRDELMRWRNPSYRKKLLEKAEKWKWYSVKHRKDQLKISDQGLEQRILEVELLRTRLAQEPNPHFISRRIKFIEAACAGLITSMNDEVATREKEIQAMKARDKERKSWEKREWPKVMEKVPKIIVAPAIIPLAFKVRHHLCEVLQYLAPRLDPKEAMGYWNEIDAWAEM